MKFIKVANNVNYKKFAKDAIINSAKALIYHAENNMKDFISFEDYKTIVQQLNDSDFRKGFIEIVKAIQKDNIF